MNIYFFASRATSEKNRVRQGLIRAALERAGAVVQTNLDHAEAPSGNVEHAGPRLEEMDALVIEGTSGDPEVGYLLAFAISAKKTTLYLMEKGSQAKNPLKYLPAKTIPAHILVRTYHEPTISQAIGELLDHLQQGEFAEIPSIKFTLRITPLIEQYLHWKTHNTSLSKADFLRQLIIEEVIKKDEEYKKLRRLRP